MPRVAESSLQALAASSERTEKATRQALELALARLRHGNPKVVQKGAAVTPTSVAREAGVRRETLYRFHQPVLDQIHEFNSKGPREEVRRLRTELAAQRATVKELRRLAENAQKAEEGLARVNHRLTARVAELEQLLRVRDETIRDLRQGSNTPSRVVAIDRRRP